MKSQKIYRLDKETFEITEINPERALKIIGYYYRNPQGVLETADKPIITPYAYFSIDKKLLDDLKLRERELDEKI